MKKSTKPKEFKVIITIRDERKNETPTCCSTVNDDLYYEQVERAREYGRMKRECDCY